MQRLDGKCQGQPFGCLCFVYVLKWCKPMIKVDLVDMTYTLDVGW